jgi:hypothetical protein
MTDLVNVAPPEFFWSVAGCVGILTVVGLDLLVRKHARSRWAFRILVRAMCGRWRF